MPLFAFRQWKGSIEGPLKLPYMRIEYPTLLLESNHNHTLAKHLLVIGDTGA
jgi:hypothetical protein